MLIGSQKDLLGRLESIYGESTYARSLAVLAGSGLTASTIAGAKRIVEAVRRGLSEEDQADLDERLAKCTSDSETYQTTFSFLALRKSPEYRDNVIRLVTLGAYAKKPEVSAELAPQKLSEFESDVDNWKMSAGVEALGRIWAGTSAQLRGPILTTNFDPLCEVAIRRAGAVAITNVIDTDGSFLRDVHVSSEPHVVHFHGFWRESATLSMMSQLTQQRPALSASLRGLLKKSTLLVVGYGGWQDALTAQVVQAINEQEATSLDVLWCSFAKEDQFIASISDNPVLEQLTRAPGNVQFYAGIDVNALFPEFEKRVSQYLSYRDVPRRATAQSGLIGWSLVTPAASPRTTIADRSAAIKFFDGRLPNWHDAASPLIPLRAVSSAAMNQVRNAVSGGESSLTLLLGPSGEGKTTALMQIASGLAGLLGDDATVMFHADGGLPAAADVLALPVKKANVVVLDEAGRCVDRLRDLVERVNQEGRTDLHLVVAARLTDWQNAGGPGYAWSKHIRVFRHDVIGVSRADAASIVDAWTRIGPDALGDLHMLPDREARIAALIDASTDGERSDEGAFLGALLKTRFGAGLGDHVVELMDQLSHWRIAESGVEATLLDAFSMIALPHSRGLRSLTPEVLARALSVSIDDLYHSVLPRLGDEAAISYTRDAVLIRHRSIALVAVDRAAEAECSVEDAARRVVSAAVSLIKENGYEAGWGELAYLGRSLPDGELAIAAAEAAVETDPYRLSYRTSLSRALRRAGRSSDACDLARESFSSYSGMSDVDSGGRPFFTEWGVAEGNEARWANNVVLASLALQDIYSLGELGGDHARQALGCLSIAFRRLVSAHPDASEYVRAVLAVAELGSRGYLRSVRERWAVETEAWLDRRGMQSMTLNTKDAISALQAAATAATESSEDALSSRLPKSNFKFASLARLAEG